MNTMPTYIKLALTLPPVPTQLPNQPNMQQTQGQVPQQAIPGQAGRPAGSGGGQSAQAVMQSAPVNTIANMVAPSQSANQKGFGNTPVSNQSKSTNSTAGGVKVGTNVQNKKHYKNREKCSLESVCSIGRCRDGTLSTSKNREFSHEQQSAQNGNFKKHSNYSVIDELLSKLPLRGKTSSTYTKSALGGGTGIGYKSPNVGGLGSMNSPLMPGMTGTNSINPPITPTLNSITPKMTAPTTNMRSSSSAELGTSMNKMSQLGHLAAQRHK